MYIDDFFIIKWIVFKFGFGNIWGIKGVFFRKIGFNKWILR